MTSPAQGGEGNCLGAQVALGPRVRIRQGAALVDRRVLLRYRPQGRRCCRYGASSRVSRGSG